MMQTQFGKYTLLDKLGDGGMAEVFLAQIQGPEGFTKLVALKRILPHLSNDDLFTRSFINEARLGGYLNHHNIVQTLEFGQHDHFYYLAMEYVRGVTLADVLGATKARREPLPTELAIQITLQMAEGLAYAHAAEDAEGRPLRMVHRDLKPSNILINNHGVCKIADFGVARSESNIQHTVLAGEVKGTVCYMSPEQAMGRRDLDQRSDLYSLGAIFFELLVNERLYPEENYLASLRQVQDGQVADRLPMVLELEQGIRLYQILSKTLAAEREERYASVFDLTRDLREILASFSLEWDLSDYLKALLPNSPLTMRGTVMNLPVAAAAQSGSSTPPPPPGAQPQPPRVERLHVAPQPVSSPRPPMPPHPMVSEATLNPHAGRDVRPPERLSSTPRLHPPPPHGAEISQNTMERQPPHAGPRAQQTGTEQRQTGSSPTPPRSLARRPELWIGLVVLAIAVGALGLKLSMSTVEVPVISVPPGATLTAVDGRSLGRTPLRVAVPSGGLTLVAELPGFDAQTLNIPRTQDGEYLIRLNRNRASFELEVIPSEARVELNGALLPGASPYRKDGLAPGRHSLRIELAGYEPVDMPIELTPGETRPLKVELQPAGTQPAPPGATTARTSRPAPANAPAAQAPQRPQVDPADRPSRPQQPAPRPQTAPAPAQKEMGALTLNAFPFAHVEIDGKPIKTTPLINYPLEAGTHSVKLTTETGREQTLQLTVQPGETLKKIVRFDAP